jgi:DNA-binding beta-propeller fold protein YncE
VISPYLLYYSRYIRDEPFVLVWGTLIALCVIRYMETRGDMYLYGLAAVTALFYTTMEASFIYVAISMLFLGLHLVRELFAVRWPKPEYRQPFQIAFALTIGALLVAGAFLFVGRLPGLSGTETAVPANPGAPVAAASTTAAGLSQVAAVAVGVALVGLVGGFYVVIRAFGQEVRRFPAVDLLMVFGLFVLPQLTAFPVTFLRRDPQNYTIPAGTNFFTFFGTDAGVTATVCLLLLAASVVIGWVWDRRRFLICAAIFYSIFITLFTTFFTNGWGIATGTIGSLGYWLAQQGVQRGNQPWYYYLVINLPLYEFLPAIGGLFAGALLLRRWLRMDHDPAAQAEADTPISPSDTLGFPVIPYFGFWAVMSVVAFSLAGEKMPWLTNHLTLPLILLSGWSIGKFIDGTDWTLFRERKAWLVALLLPVAVVALSAALGSLVGSNPPFQGTDLQQLQSTGVFISGALVAIIGGVALYGLGAQLGFSHLLRLATLSVFGLLALLTARAAFIATYVNYDDANEFMVYAHGARGVKTVISQIEDISLRTKDGLGLKVAYDSDVAWPMTWYFRDFTNQSYYGDQPTREALDSPVVIAGPKHWSKVESLLGDRYFKFEYIRMVWPMQEYFNLNWQRISYALTSPQYRQAMWNIWYKRDYASYGQLTSTNYDLSQWPVSERMRLYVRKDIASQIWSYGVGPTQLTANVAPADPYVKSKQVLKAVNVWGSEGAQPGQFEAPRGVALAPDGSIYVADSRNNRIQKFDGMGKLLLAWGSLGSLDAKTANPGTFNEPWGVAVAADGSVYVSDTWNHRIQKFDANGKFLQMWGIFGQAETPDAFWGPRAIAIDGQGRVYVADTGNKRIVVFDANGQSLNVIGGAGTDPGQFDEPVGLAVTSDGTLYVADTWNQRIQQFKYNAAGNTYDFVRQWAISAWFGQSIDNKPFIALDPKGRLYVTDPEGYRVLVFDQQGKFLTTWGDFGTDDSTFGLASALAIDPTGKVVATDAGNHRVLQFPPLP